MLPHESSHNPVKRIIQIYLFCFCFLVVVGGFSLFLALHPNLLPKLLQANITNTLFDEQSSVSSSVSVEEKDSWMSQDGISFSIETTPESLYVRPDSKDVSIAAISIFYPEDATLQEIRLRYKASEIHRNFVNVRLRDQDKIFTPVKEDAREAFFSGLDIPVRANETKMLEVLVDVPSEAVVGDRFSFGVEKSSDIIFGKNLFTFHPEDNFPMFTKMITVVGGHARIFYKNS